MSSEHDARLTLERIFSEPDLGGRDVDQVRFSPDGQTVSFARAGLDSAALSLWTMPADGSDRAQLLYTPAAQASTLSAEETARRERQRIFAQGVVAHHWHPRGETILVASDGDYLWVDAKGKTAKRLVLEVGEIVDPQISPRGDCLAFVRDGALSVMAVADGRPNRISPLAGEGVRYGVAEFVAQEEFARDTGFWWSPNGEAIAYARIDESAIDEVRWVEVGADGPHIASQRFPRAGSANACVGLWICNLRRNTTVQVDLGPDPNFYLGRVHWSADGRRLFVQRQSRDQGHLDVLVADPESGIARVLISEARDPWINLNLDFRPLADGGFLWVSERSGRNELWRVSADGCDVLQVTRGIGPLASRDRERALVGVDEVNGMAFVMASGDGALERHLYAADLRRGSAPRKLTAGEGRWRVTMDPRCKAYVGRFSDPAQPPRTGLFSLSGDCLGWLAENKFDDTHPYAPYRSSLPVPEFGQIEAEDGQPLDYVLLKPNGFELGRRYPAIVQVYGGPGRQHVHKDWRPPAERVFLDAGFVFFQLDNRGACGRGLAFEAPIAGRLGGPEVEDQLRGLNFLRSQPFVDAGRIGCMGWSYGGYMTLRLMTDPRARLQAGIAGGSVDDFIHYDTYYSERFLGLPQSAPDVYRRSAVLPRLGDLSGRLMLVHGTADDNVLFEHALRLMSELQRLGKTFDVMIYPGQRHAIVGRENKIHLARTQLEFFQRHLAAGARSA